jgi:hypothetical protein
VRSRINQAIVHRRERVVIEEEVVSPEEVVLQLRPEEFLALWALEYMRGDGNVTLRADIEAGLNLALNKLMTTSAFAREFKKALQSHENYSDLAFVRITKALAAAEEAVA